LKAIWKKQVLAESDKTQFVEGSHYFPPDTVNRNYLLTSDKHTICPWRGIASYYHILVNGDLNTHAAWYYPEPKPEAEQLKKYIAFGQDVEIID